MICSCCYSSKTEDEFPSTATGFRSYCKTCYSYIRWWNRQKPESMAVHNAASRRWTDNNKNKSNEIKKKSRIKYPNQGKKARTLWRKNNVGRINYYTANRRALKNRATPLWADRKEIVLIYKEAVERGLVVDHIVTLNSKLVCGLHVQDNLRCISPELNAYKGNHYWPYMPSK